MTCIIKLFERKKTIFTKTRNDLKTSETRWMLDVDYGFDVLISEVFGVHQFLGQISSQICCSPYLLQFIIEIRRTYISQNKLKKASQGCQNVLINKRVFYRFYHFSFAEKQDLNFCVGATSKLPVLYTINCSMQFSDNSMWLGRKVTIS